MVPSQSAGTCNYDLDLITNLPEIAIDKILKRLPIKMLANMSILSRKWRLIWLSLKYVIFDEDFWDELNDDVGIFHSKENSCNFIISNILFHHIGPVHQFHLCVPCNYNYDNLSVNGWVSLLSKVGVKKISVCKYDDNVPMPPSIFDCKDLVKLKLKGFNLNHPPNHFKGFAYLKSLKLSYATFKDDAFRTLIAKCPQLRWLILSKLNYYETQNNTHLVIDAPNLEHLTIQGFFGTIVFKNICHLRFVSLDLYYMNKVAKEKGVDHAIEMLANSCQLEDLYFGGRMCKYFGAGSIAMSPTLKFLHRLCLTEVNLNDFDEFCFTLGLLQCCPFIKDLGLHIAFNADKCVVEHEYNYNKNCELIHLVKVKITGLIGTSPELKLIEYLFSVASNLETLAFGCCYADLKSKLKVTQDISEFPRASPKAKLIRLQK